MKSLVTAKTVGISLQLRFILGIILSRRLLPCATSRKLSFPLFGKEGPGEISSITRGFHISEKKQ